MKIKKGDKVKVMVGKDKGKEGAVEMVWQTENKVTVAGTNLYKRHMKPRGEGQKGGIHELSRPYDVSKIALVCPKCKQVARIGYKLTQKDKVRVCRKCDQEI